MANCFFSQFSSTFNWPICGYNAALGASSLGLAPRRLEKILGNSSRTNFFHWVIWTGWTPYSMANSLIVHSPRVASRATFALNSARGYHRGIVVASPSPMAHATLT